MDIALTALVTFVITTLTGALMIERERRSALAARVRELEQLLANLERVGRNKLYRMALEDVGFGAAQAALRIRAIKDELAVVETILSPNERSAD